jgi:hypothetical protein
MIGVELGHGGNGLLDEGKRKRCGVELPVALNRASPYFLRKLSALRFGGQRVMSRPVRRRIF